ncbi:AAA family ATPase [Streptodolium elevatio]
MLLSFRVANHLSIHAEQQLALTPVYDAGVSDGTELRCVPVAAVFGPNAAGKSNLVDALRWMARMVRGSHDAAVPGGGVERTPFVLDPTGIAEPSWYVVDLGLGGVRYTYGFSVDGHGVREEWLFSYPLGRKRVVFQRTNDGIKLGSDVGARERELFSLIEDITAPNVLLLSVAARSRQDAVLPVFNWFTTQLRFMTHVSALTTMRRLAEGDTHDRVVSLLREADLGIEGVVLERSEESAHAERLLAQTEQELRRAVASDAESEAIHNLRKAVRDAQLLHTRARQRDRVHFIQKSRAGEVKLPLAVQSAGTQALFRYAGPLLSVLDSGGVMVVDEIDASLHPLITAHIDKLFRSQSTNPCGAQLLLTTHDATLLGKLGGEDVLERDQVWFVEKDEAGATTLFPLSDFRPRKDENRERRYLGGSYGAVPFVSDERFEAAVAVRGGCGDGTPEEAVR